MMKNAYMNEQKSTVPTDQLCNLFVWYTIRHICIKMYTNIIIYGSWDFYSYFAWDAYMNI
jgi:hypothetical protein